MGGGGRRREEWRDGDVVWLMSSLMGPVTHYFQGLSSCLYHEESGENQIFQSQVQRVHHRVLLHSGRSCSSAEKIAMFSLQLHLQFSHRGIHVIVVITMYSCMFHKFE